jgi:chondroitin AC lyase
MRKIYLFILFLGTVFFACKPAAVVYSDQLTQLHTNVMNYIREEPADPERVKELMKEMQPDGSWKNIDYTSKERGGWPTAGHLSNLLSMAKAYHTKGSPFYHKKAVSEKIHSGLNFWLENDFQCPNWWYPEIGVPMTLAPLMILMEPELTPEQMQKGIKILDRSKIGMTGQNKIWQSGNVLLKSLLLRDEETIRKAAASIQEELTVSTKEGVQADWSYHQHGPQLQFGNYGLAYVGDMIKWITILRNTPFHFDESKVAILRNYLIEGQQWVTWKNRFDVTCCGRQLFPRAQASKAASLANYFRKMETLDPDFATSYKNAGQYQTLSGNRYFWRSDYMIQRTPEYFFTVKTSSERTIGAETVNSENIQGYYMGDGATFLYRTQEEYLDIFPFWDWKKIPGVTAHQEDKPMPAQTSKESRNKSAFVGGVSNGEYGVAAMDYHRNGLKARKSWFMFRDAVICLGAGITSAQDFPVTTSVNQSFLKGVVRVNDITGEMNPGTPEFNRKATWIVHDSTGYFFPEGGTRKLENRPVEGSWHQVALRYPEERIKAPVFNLWLEHGIRPQNQSYTYIIAPNAGIAKMNEWNSKLPFGIVNRKEMQEVVTSDGSLAGMVFYEPGSSTAFGGVEADKPCLVLLKKLTDGIQVSVADPTQQLKTININLNGEFTGGNAHPGSGKTIVRFSLPEGDMAGKTVTVKLSVVK